MGADFDVAVWELLSGEWVTSLNMPLTQTND